MKKILSVMFVLMFISAMALTSVAFAGDPMDKSKSPMSDKSKEGKRISEDAKAKAKAEAEKHKTEMRMMDGKEKEKLKKKGEMDKKNEGRMKSKRF